MKIMDPKANLEEQVQLAHRLLRQAEEVDLQYNPLPVSTKDATRLAELVLSFEEWRRENESPSS